MPKHVELTSATHGSHAATSEPVITIPELLVTDHQNAIRELRVYNYRTLPSGRVVRGDGWGLLDLLLMFGLLWWGKSARWNTAKERLFQQEWISWVTEEWSVLTLCLAICLFIKLKTSVVLCQSITALPSLGVQLSTTRGLSLPAWTSFRSNRLLIPLSTSQTFIPLSDISTIIINEGIRRWSVRYYLAVAKKRGQGIVVAFDVVMPRHPILKEVYHSLRETLFEEWAIEKEVLRQPGNR